MHCVQEAASNHIVALRGRSEQYFAADPELAKQDLIFIILRMQIRMQKYPRWCGGSLNMQADELSPLHFDQASPTAVCDDCVPACVLCDPARVQEWPTDIHAQHAYVM